MYLMAVVCFKAVVYLKAVNLFAQVISRRASCPDFILEPDFISEHSRFGRVSEGFPTLTINLFAQVISAELCPPGGDSQTDCSSARLWEFDISSSAINLFSRR